MHPLVHLGCGVARSGVIAQRGSAKLLSDMYLEPQELSCAKRLRCHTTQAELEAIVCSLVNRLAFLILDQCP